MTKNFIFMRDIVCKFHPKFIESADLRKAGLENPELFNVERCVEESLAYAGNMQFVDEEGYDFLPDYSDSKTVTVNLTRKVAEISGVENKIGPLRITVYNPITSCAEFFYLPQKLVSSYKEPCYGKNSHKERIKIYFNKDGRYGYFQKFKVPSFDALALARD